jgi:purine-binding chemotaxis protein CheW
VRGSGYPIVDLRLKLDLPSVPATEATRIIILDVPMDDRLVGVGFVADCVFEVTDIDEATIEPVPSVGGRWQSDYIAGIGRKGDKFVIIFDLARLMAKAEMPAEPETQVDAPAAA